MAKFQKIVQIDSFNQSQFKSLQCGQWVSMCGVKGRFYGVKKSGSIVVAWHENAKRFAKSNKSGQSYFDYQKSLYNYAKSS